MLLILLGPAVAETGEEARCGRLCGFVQHAVYYCSCYSFRGRRCGYLNRHTSHLCFYHEVIKTVEQELVQLSVTIV